ncbi:MAG: hypothetical protein IKK63_10360 [Clostridia bacterium]|nr:hypothetical protein [Clostridia bacterium]
MNKVSNSKTSKSRIRFSKLTIKKAVRFWGKELVMVIISSILIPCLLPGFQARFEKRNTFDENIKKLNSIVIGANYEWFEDTFGTAIFTDTFVQKKSDLQSDYNVIDDLEITEYIYKIDDIAIIRAFFAGNKLEAYYITVCDEKLSGKIELPKPYATHTDMLPIGELTYKSISGEPVDAKFSASTSGVVYYSETYDYGKFFNYYTVEFLNVDYGPDFGSYAYNVKGVDVFSDDEVNTKNFPDLLQYVNTLPPRDKFKPNTYGIINSTFSTSTISERVIDIYYNFDFRALNYIENEESTAE